MLVANANYSLMETKASCKAMAKVNMFPSAVSSNRRLLVFLPCFAFIAAAVLNCLKGCSENCTILLF